MQGLCTAVSILALFPLGELFFFHMLLIKKVSMEEVSLAFICLTCMNLAKDSIKSIDCHFFKSHRQCTLSL